MAAFNFHRRQTRRWWYAGATTVVAALCMVFFVVGASALSGSPSSFESADPVVPATTPPSFDGNMVVDTAQHSDWNCFANGNSSGFVGSGINVGAACSSSLNKAAGVDLPDLAASTSDDSWINGTKFDNPCEPVGTNKNPGKDDFINVASYSEVRSSDKHTFLYGATVRYTANGSASENVELSQVAGGGGCAINRTAGDHLLAFDYNSGGKVLNLHVLTWITNDNPGVTDILGGNNGTCIIGKDNMPCWGANVITPADASFDGDTNLSAILKANNGINGGSSGQDLVAGQFAEFGVDLTTALQQNPNACNTTNQITWESRSSGSSFSSNPEDISIEKSTISNCGKITIVKNTAPRNQNQNFSYTASGGTISPTSFKLNDRSALTITAISNANPAVVTTAANGFTAGDKVGVTISGSNSTPLADGNWTATVIDATHFSIPLAVTTAGTAGSVTFNTIVYRDVLGGSSYTFTESTQSGWKLTSLTCTNKGTGVTSVVNLANRQATIPLAANDDWVCTYVNTPLSATLGTQVDSGSPFVPGAQVRDTATVTGSDANITPNGSVTFYLCHFAAASTSVCDGTTTDADGSTGVQLNATATAVSGSGATATATSPYVNTAASPKAAGRYCFRAVYGSDTNYPGTITEYGGSTGATECFDVAKVNAPTTTTPNDGTVPVVAESTIVLGSTIYDTAVVQGTAGLGFPTGKVHFYVCTGSAACTDSGTDKGNKDLTQVGATVNSTATSDGFTPTATGTYCFLGVYSGDTVYNGSSDSAATECFTVTDTTTSTSAQTWYPNDSASVSSNHGGTVSGTLTITLYTGNNCGATSGSAVTPAVTFSSGAKTNQSSITVDSNKQTTFGVTANTPPSAQAFSWKAVFTSSDTNLGSSSHCESSSLTIND